MKIFGEGVVVIAVCGLAGFSKAAAVVCDYAMPGIEKHGNLFFPRRAAQWISVNQDNRLTGAVIFIVEVKRSRVFSSDIDVGHLSLLIIVQKTLVRKFSADSCRWFSGPTGCIFRRTTCCRAFLPARSVFRKGQLVTKKAQPARLRFLEVRTCRGFTFFPRCGRRSASSAAHWRLAALPTWVWSRPRRPWNVPESGRSRSRKRSLGMRARQAEAESRPSDFRPQRGSPGSARVHREQSLRLRHEVHRARLSGDHAGRFELHSCRRHRVDVPPSLLPRRRALGIPPGQSGTGRWHVPRRIFLPSGADGHGRNRRSARRAIQNYPR